MPASDQDVVLSDTDALAQLITLPMQPERVTWKLTALGENSGRVPGPTDYTLRAVLKLSAKDATSLRAQAQPHARNWNVVWEESHFEAWYPDSVKQSFTFDASAGKYHLNGSVYDAAALFGKPPFTSGSFIITDSDEVFLSLSTQ
jgi:hypothetical protein